MTVQVISFRCEVKNRTGQLISSSYNREVLNAPAGQDARLSGLVRGLQNLKKGERRSIALKADEAYGLYDPKKVIFFPRAKLQSDLKRGQTVSIVGKFGVTRKYTVVELNDEIVTLDGNHPLAGQDLVFEIEALDVRSATDQEIEESSGQFSADLLH